jgi:hypothetical protein
MAQETVKESKPAEEIQNQKLKQRIGKLFSEVYTSIDQTRKLVDQQESLPDKTLNPFGTDKRSNQSSINALLDEAIAMLDNSEVSECRDRISANQKRIQQSYNKIAEHRRLKISAPLQKDLGRLDKLNPFKASQEQYDLWITEEQQGIAAAQDELRKLKLEFVDHLRAIGLRIDEKGVDAILGSISGDELVSMAIVFDNIKHLTTQLQELTAESGEALEESKRYYGMYLVMVKIVDRMQKSFVEDIHQVHLPKLKGYSEQANGNIQQAKRLIATDGGDKEILRKNIASNELTQQTAELYMSYLRQNAALITKENKGVERSMATATNTYLTVKLSSDVAALIKSGRQNFDALMKLQVPEMREFANENIRKEFARMTEELRAGR